MIRQSIKDTLLLSGKVSFSYKARIDDWIGEAKIYFLGKPWNVVCIEFPKFRKEFNPSKMDEAIALYCDKIFSKANLALSYRGIEEHDLLPFGKDFDDLNKEDLKNIIKKYKEEYFDKDYPKELIK